MPPKAATAGAAAPKTPATPEKTDEVVAAVNPEDDVNVRSGTFSFSDGAKYSYDHVFNEHELLDDDELDELMVCFCWYGICM